jgi:uncharacterized protein (TIGR02611 family)
MSLAVANSSWKKFRRFFRLNGLSPGLKRVVVAIVGATVVFAGLAMIVLPGPALLMIPLGLGILATEFAWARRCLRKARDWVKSARNRWRSKQDRKL